MSDLSPRYGSPVRGALHAAGAALKYIVVPLVLIAILDAIMSRDHGSIGDTNLQPLLDLLAQLQPIVLYLGSVLGVLAFLAWFYPKGSRSRLGFAIAFEVVVAAYVWMLLQDGRTEAAIASVGPDLPLFLLFELFVVLVAFSVAQALGDYRDHRREWLYRRDQAGDALPPLPPLYPEDAAQHHFYHDFRPRYGQLSEGIRVSRKAVKKFVIYPLAFFIIAAAVLAYVPSAGLGDVQNVFDATAGAILLVGILITALSFFKGFYPKGSCSRLAFAVLVAVAWAGWVWIITFGGHIDVATTVGGSAITMRLDFQPLVLLFVFAALLWAVYAVVELLSYRKDWIAGGFVPVNDRLIRQRKREEKERRRLERKAERDAAKAQSRAARSKGKKEI